jgi:hypothetical protein
MNEQLICEATRAGTRGLVYFVAVLMCCIRSDASFFHARWPLFVSVTEPMTGSEK